MTETRVDACRLETLDERRKSTELDLGEVGIVLGHRQVGPYAAEAQAIVGGNPLRQLERHIGVCPYPMHPGVDLEVDLGRSLDGAGRNRLDECGGVDGADEAGVDDRGDLVDGGLGEQQDRRIDACVSQANPLGDDRYGKPGRSSREGRFRYRHITVPVSVGLHDRTQLGWRNGRGHGLHIAADCIEIDLDPRWPHHAYLPTKEARSAAVTARDAARCAPALPCQYAPERAAASRSRPRSTARR